MADETDELDLLELLTADHANLRGLVGTAGFPEAVTRHVTAERELLYPAVEKEKVASPEEVSEMRSLDTDLERAAAAGDPAEMGRTLETHVSVQQALFDLARTEVSRERLVALGRRVADSMEEAPTHIHPHLPDHGPLQRVVSDLTATIDQVEDSLPHRDR